MPEVRTTSVTGGQKGTKLARFDLIPQGPLIELAEHFGVGALKYAGHQWRQGYEWSKSIAAKARHDAEFAAGRDYDVCSNDPEGCQHVDADGEPFVAPREDACYNHTGSHHLAASAWHAFVLLEFKDRFPGFDDRYDPTADDEKYAATQMDQFVLHESAAPGEPLGPEWEEIGYLDADNPGFSCQADGPIQWRDPEPITIKGLQEAINELYAFTLPVRFIAGVDPAEVTDDQAEERAEAARAVDIGLLSKHAPRNWVADYDAEYGHTPVASAIVDLWVDTVGSTD